MRGLLSITQRLARYEIDRNHRVLGWYGLGLTAAGVLSLVVAALFFD